jgi:uncharacterized membrane protein YkoI
MKSTIFTCLAAAVLVCWGGVRAFGGPNESDRKRALEGLDRAKINLADAVHRALTRIPDGKAVEASLEGKQDDITYEIEIVSGGKHRIVEVDPISGAIDETGGEKIEENKEDASEHVETMISKAPVTLVQAVETALRQHQQAKVYRVEPEKEQGKLVFSISLLSDGKFMTVDVDANSREIVHHGGKG